MNITGIILAAGKSERMGTPKWELSIGGQSFLDRIVTTFRDAGISKPIVVFRDDPGDFPDEYQILINPSPDRGQLSSLQTAFTYLTLSTPFIMHLIDRPLVRSDTIKKMIETFDDQQILIPSFIGHKGHPVIFPADCVGQIKKADYRDGIRGVIKKWFKGVKILDVDDEAILWNIDTPAELKYYENIVKEERRQ